MALPQPYPPELLRIARKVVWFNAPEHTLNNVPMLLVHLMVYGSGTDVASVEQYIPETEFRSALEQAPAGVFTLEAWTRWHHRFGIFPVLPLPRRRFPDGTVGPEPDTFFGR